MAARCLWGRWRFSGHDVEVLTCEPIDDQGISTLPKSLESLDGEAHATLRRGPRGAKGSIGATGPKGARAPSVSQDVLRGPTTSLSVVESQLREIREHLHVQLVRTGQLQVELDRIIASGSKRASNFTQGTLITHPVPRAVPASERQKFPLGTPPYLQTEFPAQSCRAARCHEARSHHHPVRASAVRETAS